MTDILSQRAINRATLDRQLLLRRASIPAAAAIEHLAGMQTQAPRAPFVGLWTRLLDFRPAELDELIESRQAVRTALMRCTLHLVSARDCLAMRPILQPVLERGYWASPAGRNVKGMDVDALLDAGRALLAERPRTRVELGRELVARWSDRSAEALAYTVSYLEPLVQIPPRGTWSGSGQATWTTVSNWLDHSAAPMAPDDLLLRYLGAFGPATVMDAQAWCGLTRLGEVAARLGNRLRRFHDVDGRVLLDVPSAPRPDPDTPAPARFLPEYDNLLLSYADRSRVVPDGQQVPLWPGNGATRGEVLVDGRWAANWALSRAGSTAVLSIEPFARLARRDVAEVGTEGAALLAWTAPGLTPDVRILPP